MDLEPLLTKKVSRRQFLGAIAAVAFALTGIPAILGLLTKNQASTGEAPGYGMRDYGP